MADASTILDALADLLADRVAERVAQRLAAPTTAPTKDLVRKSELAQYLGVTGGTVDRYASQGMPYVQVGGQRRYRLTDVDEWLETRTRAVRSRQPIEDTCPVPGVRLLSSRRTA